MLATSTDAEDETPFPSGTAEETCLFLFKCFDVNKEDGDRKAALFHLNALFNV